MLAGSLLLQRADFPSHYSPHHLQRPSKSPREHGRELQTAVSTAPQSRTHYFCIRNPMRPGLGLVPLSTPLCCVSLSFWLRRLRYSPLLPRQQQHGRSNENTGVGRKVCLQDHPFAHPHRSGQSPSNLTRIMACNEGVKH
ncbi:hypothetical protein CC79DRAFT_73970 [Sarocladium strictum]